MSVTIGALRESTPRETRVCLVPEVAEKLAREGARVLMERGAGVRASFPDSLYKSVTWADSAAGVLAASEVILTVQPLSVEQIQELKPSAAVIGFMQPHARAAEVRELVARGITSFAMELVPRISRAQSMDALSSQASIAGYKAVLIAASHLQKFLPMLTTAAGTIRPSQLLIIGAGVAGLQAIATARRLGAMVEAYDVRSATREQVKSLGAKFVDTGVSAEGSGGYARELAAVERMRAGSVVVDIAAEQGGNCELTRAGEVVEHQGVKVVGPVNLPAELAYNASEMYARNLYNFLKPALAKGELVIDWSDEVFAQSCLTSGGQIKHEATAKALEG